MKHMHAYALIVMVALHAGCGAPPKEGEKEGTSTATNKSSPRSNELNSPSRYVYMDPEGKNVILENHLPKGGTRYTAPDGQTYGLVVFWSQFTNETSTPLEVEFNLPATAHDFPYPQHRYLRLLVPADTMTLEKIPLLNYGLNQLKPFLDSNFYAPSLLKRTIGPNASSGFYVVLATKTDSTIKNDGTLRTGFSLKGQELFYRVSNYMPKPPTIPLTGEKEYPFGRINLKNLKAVE